MEEVRGGGEGGRMGLMTAGKKSNTMEYQCEHCLKSFRFHCRLKRHLSCHYKAKTHNIPEQSPPDPSIHDQISAGGKGNEPSEDEDSRKVRRRRDLACDLCGKCFTQKNNLHRHRLVHLGSRPFHCEECGLRFADKCALDRHQEVHMGGVREHECAHCHRAFSRKSNLQRHALTHSSGAGRHVCSMCGKSFGQRAHLRRHQETHGGAKVLACAECGKRFNRRGNLKVHLLLHSGVRMFECRDCGRKFSQKGNLKIHRLTLHKKVEVHAH